MLEHTKAKNEPQKTFKWPWKIKVSSTSSKFRFCASLMSCDFQILGTAWNASEVTLVPKIFFFPKNFELGAKFCGVQSKPGWRYEPRKIWTKWKIYESSSSHILRSPAWWYATPKGTVRSSTGHSLPPASCLMSANKSRFSFCLWSKARLRSKNKKSITDDQSWKLKHNEETIRSTESISSKSKRLKNHAWV